MWPGVSIRTFEGYVKKKVNKHYEKKPNDATECDKVLSNFDLKRR